MNNKLQENISLFQHLKVCLFLINQVFDVAGNEQQLPLFLIQNTVILTFKASAENHFGLATVHDPFLPRSRHKHMALSINLNIQQPNKNKTNRNVRLLLRRWLVCCCECLRALSSQRADLQLQTPSLHGLRPLRLFINPLTPELIYEDIEKIFICVFFLSS